MAVSSSASEDKEIYKCNVKKKNHPTYCNLYAFIVIVLVIYQSRNFPVEG